MGTERLLARVVQVFGSTQAHHGYLFANARGNRIKLLLHDGFGMWCASIALRCRYTARFGLSRNMAAPPACSAVHLHLNTARIVRPAQHHAVAQPRLLYVRLVWLWPTVRA